MAFRVDFTRRALRDLTDLYNTINAQHSPAAARWFNGLEEIILSLENMPRIGSVTHEDKTVRQLMYGNKPHFYRVLYEVEEAERLVRILRVRHRRQLPPISFRN